MGIEEIHKQASTKEKVSFTPTLKTMEQYQKEREATEAQTERDKMAVMDSLPDTPDAEALRRSVVMNQLGKYNSKLAEDMSGKEWQEFMKGGPGSIEQLRKSGIPDALVKERERAMRNIMRMCEPTDPGKKTKFEITRFVMTVEEEILTIEDSLNVLQYEPGSPQEQALHAEMDFLNAVLARFHIPESREIMKKFDAYGQAKPNEKWQRSISDGSKLARLGVILVAGGIAVITGVMAIIAKPDDPSLNATLLWLIPTILAWEGKNLSRTRIEKIRDELAFMTTKEFQNASASFRGTLSEPVGKMLQQRSASAKALRTLADKTDSPRMKEKKQAARETLTGIMGKSDTTTGLLNDEHFVSFALPIVTHVRSIEAQRVMLSYLSDAAPHMRDLPPTPPKDKAIA